MTGGLDLVYINLTESAAYLTEVSRVDDGVLLKNFFQFSFSPRGNSVNGNFFNESPEKFSSLKNRIASIVSEKHILLSVPTTWGQVKVLPKLNNILEEEQTLIWKKLLNEAFSNDTESFSLNFLPKNGNETWCIGLSKDIVSGIRSLLPSEKRKSAVIVPDMALYQACFETLEINDSALYITGNKERECWFLDAAKKNSEYRLIFPDSGFPEVTYHKNLENFIMFVEKKYGLELEKIYLVDKDKEGKILEEVFGDRLFEYNSIPAPRVMFDTNVLAKVTEKRFRENFLIKIYGAAEIIN